jgi:Family of unknown function (DUF6461)
MGAPTTPQGSGNVMNQEARAGEQAWGWVRRGGREAGGCLIFVRAASPEQVIEAFGMDPGQAQMLPEARAGQALPLPVYDAEAKTVCPWVRAGRSGSWTFAISDSGLDIVRYHDDAGLRLSAGTEAVVVLWTAKPTYDVRYLVDRDVMTAFEPLRAWHRSGREPDRFLREMREAGLETEAPAPPPPGTRRDLSVPRRDYRDPLTAALDMLTLALAIRVPEEVASGPLLTIQRAPGTSGSGG